MQADISQTHPPSRIKVAFGQGFVIIGIRIREGPLRHDARNEPAEQGKKKIYVEIRASAQLQRRRPAPREHLPSSSRTTAWSWRSERTPGPPRPSRQGVAPPQKGCQGPEPTAMNGTRFAPHVRTLEIQSNYQSRAPKPCTVSGHSPRSLRTKTEATLSRPTSCQLDQSEPAPLRRPAPFSFSLVKETEVWFPKDDTG